MYWLRVARRRAGRVRSDGKRVGGGVQRVSGGETFTCICLCLMFLTSIPLFFSIAPVCSTANLSLPYTLLDGSKGLTGGSVVQSNRNDYIAYVPSIYILHDKKNLDRRHPQSDRAARGQGGPAARDRADAPAAAGARLPTSAPFGPPRYGCPLRPDQPPAGPLRRC